MAARAIPRHARTVEWQCWGYWGPGPGEGSVPGAQNPGAELTLPQEQARADPLVGPVAITERAVLGDRLRRPTAWCEMPACISRHDDPAAAGEADIRARALAAGWRHDAVGRLVCPYCQQRNPRLWVAYPLARQHPLPAGASRQHAAHARAGRIGAVWATLSAWHRQSRDARPRWPHLLAALTGGGNGPNTPKPTPPPDPATSARGRRRRGPTGPGRRPGRQAAATSPASRGSHGRRQGQPRATPRV